MTGSTETFWLNWFFEQFLESKPDCVLSIGCGDGSHEILIGTRGYAGHVFGFDASSVGIEIAKAAARDGGLRELIFEQRTFEEFAASPPVRQYDLALFAGSLHHVRDLEGVLCATRSALLPGGKVLVNEYVGACYQLYPARQLNIVNRVLSGIDPIFKSASDIQYTVPSIDLVLQTDPTEGVRSALIPTLLPLFFRTVFERPFGGALLHPLFNCLNSIRINDNSIESIALIKALINLENELTTEGVLPNDFLFGLYQTD